MPHRRRLWIYLSCYLLLLTGVIIGIKVAARLLSSEPTDRFHVTHRTTEGDTLTVTCTTTPLLIGSLDDVQIRCTTCKRIISANSTDEEFSPKSIKDIRSIYHDASLTAYDLDGSVAEGVSSCWITRDHRACGGVTAPSFRAPGGTLARLRAHDKALSALLVPLARAMVDTHNFRYFSDYDEILLASGDQQTVTRLKRYARGAFTPKERTVNERNYQTLDANVRETAGRLLAEYGYGK